MVSSPNCALFLDFHLWTKGGADNCRDLSMISGFEKKLMMTLAIAFLALGPIVLKKYAPKQLTHNSQTVAESTQTENTKLKKTALPQQKEKGTQRNLASLTHIQNKNEKRLQETVEIHCDKPEQKQFTQLNRQFFRFVGKNCKDNKEINILHKDKKLKAQVFWHKKGFSSDLIPVSKLMNFEFSIDNRQFLVQLVNKPN